LKKYTLDPKKIGISHPEFLEKYWQKHRVPGVPETISQFVSLCRESVASGMFTEQKADIIVDFVLDHPKASEIWPFTEFCALISRTPFVERIHDIVLKIIDAAEDDQALDETSSIMKLHQFDIAVEDLISSRVVITGNFEQVTRRKLERLLKISGTQPCHSVTFQTNFLIVGRKKSLGWKYENFGTKIRDAVNLKSRGYGILMLSEKSVLRTLRPVHEMGRDNHVNWAEGAGNEILGLGIPHVGPMAARELAAHFRTIDGLRAASLYELTGVSGIGDVTAASILDWFQNAANQISADLQKFEDHSKCSEGDNDN
jgi:NAD-dependent DNA ligase